MRGASLKILRNALRPGYLSTMAHKLVLRADGLIRSRDLPAIRAWCERQREEVALYATDLDAALWQEATEFGAALEEYGKARLQSFGIRMGGGGHHPLLHFLVRQRRTNVVVETGVAAGFTSAAILAALDKNGSGHLHSSDFPYFRLDNPERYIGCVVEDRLKTRWDLRILGDRKNLPGILRQCGPVELFHYDSDKSHPSRRWALGQVTPVLRPGAIVIMDDIQDDWFFRDHVEKHQLRFRVFGFQGKYLGLIET